VIVVSRLLFASRMADDPQETPAGAIAAANADQGGGKARPDGPHEKPQDQVKTGVVTLPVSQSRDVAGPTPDTGVVEAQAPNTGANAVSEEDEDDIPVADLVNSPGARKATPSQATATEKAPEGKGPEGKAPGKRGSKVLKRMLDFNAGAAAEALDVSGLGRKRRCRVQPTTTTTEAAGKPPAGSVAPASVTKEAANSHVESQRRAKNAGSVEPEALLGADGKGESAVPSVPVKRRPGRPKGSKNKPRIDMPSSAKQARTGVTVQKKRKQVKPSPGVPDGEDEQPTKKRKEQTKPARSYMEPILPAEPLPEEGFTTWREAEGVNDAKEKSIAYFLNNGEVERLIMVGRFSASNGQFYSNNHDTLEEVCQSPAECCCTAIS